MVVVAQLVRAPDCGSGGRRFETALPPKSKPSRYWGFFCCSNYWMSSDIINYNLRNFNLFSALFRHFLRCLVFGLHVTTQLFIETYVSLHLFLTFYVFINHKKAKNLQHVK